MKYILKSAITNISHAIIYAWYICRLFTDHKKRDSAKTKQKKNKSQLVFLDRFGKNSMQLSFVPVINQSLFLFFFFHGYYCLQSIIVILTVSPSYQSFMTTTVVPNGCNGTHTFIHIIFWKKNNITIKNHYNNDKTKQTDSTSQFQIAFDNLEARCMEGIMLA